MNVFRTIVENLSTNGIRYFLVNEIYKKCWLFDRRYLS